MDESLTISNISIKERIYFLDVAKVIGTFLVIYAHLYSNDSTTRLYIYAFHMPFFFFISGIFHKRNIGIDFKRHFLKLFIPAVFFVLLHLLLSFITKCILNENSIGYLYALIRWDLSGYLHGTSMANTVCWFLFALFVIKVLADIYLLIPDKFKPLIIILFVVLSLIPSLPRSFYIKAALMVFPFYALGIELKSFINKLEFRWYFIIIIVVCIPLTYLLSNLNGRVNVFSVDFGKLPNYLNVFVFYLNAIIGSIAIILISTIPMTKIGFITQLSSALLTTVGIQRYFNQLYIYYFFGWDQGFVITTIGSIVIMLICYYIHLFLKRYAPFLVGIIR